MIGNEMNRAMKLMAPADIASLRASYERVLALVDLTVRVQDRASRRRELLRFTPASSTQIPFVPTPPPSVPAA